MDSKFNPPKDQKEFEERIAKLSPQGALGVLNSLKHRRASMTRALDIEILFYEAAIKAMQKEDVAWPPKELSGE